jgi:hypothetical protein
MKPPGKSMMFIMSCAHPPKRATRPNTVPDRRAAQPRGRAGLLSHSISGFPLPSSVYPGTPTLEPPGQTQLNPHVCGSVAFAIPCPTARLGARKAGFPAFIKPCDPSLRAHAPKGQNWFFEIKADGYRAQLHCHGGKITVFSRTGLDWTAQFSTIAAAARDRWRGGGLWEHRHS